MREPLLDGAAGGGEAGAWGPPLSHWIGIIERSRYAR
jgi:hypothetical protein